TNGTSTAMMIGGCTPATNSARRDTISTARTLPAKNATVNAPPSSPERESIATPVNEMATVSRTAVHAGRPRTEGTTDLSSAGTRPLLRLLTGDDSNPRAVG